MKRSYNQRARAEKSAETRARILAAGRELMAGADELQVEEIARRASVSVPTLYSHFGSKGGLLSALIGQVETEAGLFAGFRRVWECTNGEAALRTMLDATMGFWEHAWIVIHFSMRVRRTDAELAARIDRIDDSRRGHLLVICKRLRQEGRLRPGLTARHASSLAFAMTTPYVHEALVIQAGIPPQTARQMAVEAAIRAVIDPTSDATAAPPVDWVKLGLRPPVL